MSLMHAHRCLIQFRNLADQRRSAVLDRNLACIVKSPRMWACHECRLFRQSPGRRDGLDLSKWKAVNSICEPISIACFPNLQSLLICCQQRLPQARTLLVGLMLEVNCADHSFVHTVAHISGIQPQLPDINSTARTSGMAQQEHIACMHLQV